MFMNQYGECDRQCLGFLSYSKYQFLWLSMLESEKILVIQFMAKKNQYQKLLVLLECLDAKDLTMAMIEAAVTAFHGHYSMDVMLDILGVENTLPEHVELKNIALCYGLVTGKKKRRKIEQEEELMECKK
jgi:hypothetical protein